MIALAVVAALAVIAAVTALAVRAHRRGAPPYAPTTEARAAALARQAAERRRGW